MATERPTEAALEYAHPFEEKRNFHPTDRLLRKHGFRIKYRPKGGPARWERGGKVYLQADAVTLCELEGEAKGA